MNKKSILEDYGIYLDQVPLKCDNTSAINLTKNPILHSKTKHIEIRHHFIRDYVSKGESKIEYIDTTNQLAYIFIKPLSKDRFYIIRNELSILDITCLS